MATNKKPTPPKEPHIAETIMQDLATIITRITLVLLIATGMYLLLSAEDILLSMNSTLANLSGIFLYLITIGAAIWLVVKIIRDGLLKLKLINNKNSKQ